MKDINREETRYYIFNNNKKKCISKNILSTKFRSGSFDDGGRIYIAIWLRPLNGWKCSVLIALLLSIQYKMLRIEISAKILVPSHPFHYFFQAFGS